MITLGLNGAQGVADFLRTLRQGALDLRNANIRIGSRLPYAYGIHEGHTRTGRLARKAGGARFLAKAIQQVAPGVPARLKAAWRRGPVPLRNELQQIGKDLVEAAIPHTPERSGALRESLHFEMARRG